MPRLEVLGGWEPAGKASGGAVGRLKVEFRHSDAFGEPTSVETLLRRRSDHLPRLSEDGIIDQFILAGMDGEHSLDQIAREVRAHLPGRFPDH